MNQEELINAMLGTKSQKYLGERMGMSLAAINRSIKNGNMTVNRLWEICEALGYEIVVQPTKRGKRPDGQIVFSGETKQERAKKLKGDAE